MTATVSQSNAEGLPSLASSTDAMIRLTGQFWVPSCMMRATPTAAKTRQVFAVLALNAGSLVSIMALGNELWADRPPRSFITTLQTYILQLRKFVIEDVDPKKLIERLYGGYRLNVEHSQVDVLRFKDALGRVRRGKDPQELETEWTALQAACLCLSGPFLPDMQLGGFLESEMRGIEEGYLAALLRRYEIAITLQRPGEVMYDLTAMGERFPTNEGFARVRMLALHMLGRRTEAIEVFRVLRATLVGQFGLEPSDQVCVLHQEILRGAPPRELLCLL